MGRDRGPSVFSSTHRRLNDSHQMGHSLRQLQDRASFDNAPVPGCLLVMVSAIITAIVGVIFSV